MKPIGWIVLATVLVFTAAGLLVLGCGDEDEQEDDDWNLGDDEDDLREFLDSIPDTESLTLSLPESDKGGKGLGDIAVYYEFTVDFTRDVNAHVLMYLSWIDEITSYPPSGYENGTFYWGPWRSSGLSPVDARFVMTRVSEDIFDYWLQWRPKDSQDDWTDIWTGNVIRSTDTARRGEGDFLVDFTAAYLLDPTLDLEGEIDVDYDTVTDGREINVHYMEVFNNEENWSGPITGDYYYHNHTDNTGSFLFDWWNDIHWEQYHGVQYGQDEHAWLNTRWQSSGAGRCDVVVRDGDLPDIEMTGWIVDRLEISECWGSDFLRDYYMQTVWLTNGESFEEGEGQAESCVFDLEMPQ